MKKLILISTLFISLWSNAQAIIGNTDRQKVTTFGLDGQVLEFKIENDETKSVDLSSILASGVPITQEDYDNLTEQEKEAKDYFIIGIGSGGLAGGNLWSDPVDSDILPPNMTYDIGSSSNRFSLGYFNQLYLYQGYTDYLTINEELIFIPKTGPSSSIEGRAYYDSDDSRILLHDGTSYRGLAFLDEVGGGGGGGVTDHGALTGLGDDDHIQYLNESRGDARYVQVEVDGSITNELQTISKVGSTVTLSDGGGSFTDDDTQLSTEQVQDIAGGMWIGNAESGISVIYQDDDGTMDATVSAGTSNIVDGAVTEAKIATAVMNTINGKAAVSHTHTIANVTSLQSSLDGKANSSHAHNTADVNAGTFAIARIPTGTTSTTVSLGNHAHTFAQITSKPTTISGFGITDGVITSRTITAGTGLTGGGNLTTNRTISANFGTTAGTISEGNHTHTTSQVTNFNTSGDARWLGISAKAVDANLLDGIDSGSFLRSDANDVKTSGYLRFNDNISLEFGSGNDSHIYHNGVDTYFNLNVGNLHIRDNTTTRFTFSRTTGNLTVTGNMNADGFYEASDIRLKQNIKQISPSFYSFEYKAKPGEKRYGAIAQDVEMDYPELVETNEKGMKSVNYIDLLVKKVAELENRIIELEKIKK